MMGCAEFINFIWLKITRHAYRHEAAIGMSQVTTHIDRCSYCASLESIMHGAAHWSLRSRNSA